MVGWGRAALDDSTAPSFLGRFSFLIEAFKKLDSIQQVILNNSQGRAEDLPWLHSMVKVQKKGRKNGVDPCRSPALSTSFIAVSYARSLDPMNHR
jgi:hypothetical protein